MMEGTTARDGVTDPSLPVGETTASRHGVTAAGSESVDRTETRNARLAEAKARIAELVGVTTDDPDGDERRGRVYRAGRTAECCGSCGRALGPGEPVWMVRLPAARSFITGVVTRWQAPVCAACAAPESRYGDPFDDPLPCGGCGRAVSYRRERVHRRWAACSERCALTARNRRRAAARVRARAKRCAACGRPFAATREDAVTCSRACRQKAYRRRAAGRPDGPIAPPRSPGDDEPAANGDAQLGARPSGHLARARDRRGPRDDIAGAPSG